jgi:hypothetical protein
VQDGETVTYGIRDGSNSEVGRGVYTSSGTTLTRSVLTSTNSNSAINLSGSATVFITPLAEDVSYANRNIAYNAPLASQFTTSRIIIRSGGTSDTTALTITDQTAAALLSDPGSGTRAVKGLMRGIPAGMQAGNAFEVAGRFLFPPTAKTNASFGVCIGDGTNLVHWIIYTNNAYPNFRFDAAKGTTGGSWTDSQYGANADAIEWLKLAYDASSNLTFSCSKDGTNWYSVYTSTLSTMGCTSPTEYGVALGRYDNGTVNAVIPYLFSTELTAPTTSRPA